jgi:general secretion pathway protein M
MKEWFEGLDQREQRILMIGAAALVVLMLYSFVWEPFGNKVEMLREGNKLVKQDLQWMKQAGEIMKKQKGSSSTVAKKPTKGTLLGIVDRTVKANGLGSALKRVQPDKGKVRISLEQASFDKMVVWLEKLNKQYYIGIENVMIEKQEASGMVNVRLVLNEASS